MNILRCQKEIDSIYSYLNCSYNAAVVAIDTQLYKIKGVATPERINSINTVKYNFKVHLYELANYKKLLQCYLNDIKLDEIYEDLCNQSIYLCGVLMQLTLQALNDIKTTESQLIYLNGSAKPCSYS